MRATGVTVLLLAALCAASAARVMDDSFFNMKESWSNVGTVQRWMSDNKDKSHHPAYVAFKYFVAPEDKKTFIDAWTKLEDQAKDEEGIKIFDLKKPVTNNYMFVGYGEWKSLRDYMEHFDSKYVQEFLDTLRENDIEWTLVPLMRPDVAELHKEDTNKGKTSKQQAHVIIRYEVPPSKQDKFLDAWNQAEKGTEEEKGAHIYSLRQVLQDNTHFIAYGTWETQRDFAEHFESDHVRELRKNLDSNGITWELAPLFKIGDQPE